MKLEDTPSNGVTQGKFANASEVFVFPTSSVQRRLWFLDQWEAGTAVYNTPVVYRFSGSLNIEALKKCVYEIVRRHEVLRTTFARQDETVVQRVRSNLHIQIPFLEIAPEPNWEASLWQLVSDEVRIPFNLEQGPLIRAKIFRVNADDHVLSLTFHHIIFDGWSEGVLFHELYEIYSSFCQSRPFPLPDLPIQYGDYAVWQSEQLMGSDFQRQLSYWKNQLNGLGSLDFPSDRPRPAMQTYRGAERLLSVPTYLLSDLKSISRHEKATLFMTLAAALQILLHRYSGQDDLSLGIVVSGRNQIELEGMLGCFVNTLTLRADMSANLSFRQLLCRTRETALAAYANQDLPFERIVEEIQQREVNRSPLFQILFNQAPTMMGKVFGDLLVRRVRIDLGVAKFDMTLSLSAEEGPSGLEGWLEYNTDLFEADTIDRFFKHYLMLLEGIGRNPDAKVWEIPMLTEAEKHQAIWGWNREIEWRVGACLHERFEKQVKRTPEAIAISFENERLTYGDLNRRANRLAHELRRRGVVRDQLVGLRVDRGLNMIVGILGILKAGGAYLPIDPEYPSDRVSFMLEDSQVAIIVTESKRTAEIENSSVIRILLDEERSGPETNPENVATPESLAYVIYTSGSTGRPKGVMITHQNVGRLFDATEDWFHLGTQDVWTMFHSYAFDFSVWEIWGALLYGGRLVVVPYWISRDPRQFRELLVREQVTVLSQTPSAFWQLIQEEMSHSKADYALRYIIFGGEALKLQNLRPWIERYGDTDPQLVNMYGITETTVHVTYRPIRQIDVESGRGSVIGVPIPDLQVYILDRYGQPVPIGVPGEICVGGAGVARGYLNRQELTEQRFIKDPFKDSAGARLYRSGDLARRLADGDIEYLGRIDHQVKIRGFRIELGEIETAIRRHPEIKEAVVIVREDLPGEERLTAYLVTRNAGADFIAQLRTMLRRTIPEYMVPTHFVVMKSFPLTENGKLDRKSLPVPQGSEMESFGARRLSMTDTERRLAEIWKSVLCVDDVGTDQSFFDLGGHSLLAIKIIWGIKAEWFINLPLQDLFSYKTIEQLAPRIEELLTASQARSTREYIEI